MKFGNILNNATDSGLAYYGVIDDGEEVNLTLDEGGIYILYTIEFNISTGGVRGHRARLIAVPTGTRYGATACSYVSIAASTNSAVTITMEDDSTITLAQTTPATYSVKYAIQKIY